jgi:hypothetical protein
LISYLADKKLKAMNMSFRTVNLNIFKGVEFTDLKYAGNELMMSLHFN